MKVVVNACFGGYSLSEAVYMELGIPWDGYGCLSGDGEYLERTDPKLISAIEKIGLKESSGSLASLRIVEIPDDIKWHIEEYDGIEHVAENHRTW